MEVLTREDKERIADALKQAEALKKELLKARRAGLDVTSLESELANAVQQLTQIKRVYFTER